MVSGKLTVHQPNLVVLTSKPRVEPLSTAPKAGADAVLRPVTVQKGAGKKFTPAEMAKRDEAK
ncbi:hypothetical protein COOONC_10082 [Cooperia oncophora]